MSKITDRVNYLKGLAAGMKLNMDKDSNKLMLEMLNVMGEMAEEIANLTEAHDDLNDYVESIDEDLADLEETLFGDKDEEDHCSCDEDDDEEDDDPDGEEEDDDDDLDFSGDDTDAPAGTEDELISYACPHCGQELEFNPSDVDFNEDYLCPSCGKPIFPELEEDEEEIAPPKKKKKKDKKNKKDSQPDLSEDDDE